MSVQKLRLNLDVELIKNLYSNGNSLSFIADLFEVSPKVVRLRLLKENIELRGVSESLRVSQRYRISSKNKKKFKVWSKGLSKNNKKFSDSIKKGKETQIRNGKNKGENNPMWGKTTSVKSGYRKDLGHYVRSSWEANFSRILNFLDIPYIYEKKAYTLTEGDTYTPDFYIESKDMFYEVKGWMSNDKLKRFKEQYPDIRICLVDERFYKRLLKKYSSKIKIDLGMDILTKEEISEKYVSLLKTEKKLTPSIFCKKTGIPIKSISNAYGSLKNFITENIQKISETEKDILRNEIKNYVISFNSIPTYSELKIFFPRSQSLLKKYYNNKILSLKEELICKE